MNAQDKKKSEWELQEEIEDLKKKKNKDIEEIKILKVELSKLESLYKRFKESTDGPANLGMLLPTLQLSHSSNLHSQAPF